MDKNRLYFSSPSLLCFVLIQIYPSKIPSRQPGLRISLILSCLIEEVVGTESVLTRLDVLPVFTFIFDVLITTHSPSPCCAALNSQLIKSVVRIKLK